MYTKYVYIIYYYKVTQHLDKLHIELKTMNETLNRVLLIVQAPTINMSTPQRAQRRMPCTPPSFN